VAKLLLPRPQPGNRGLRLSSACTITGYWIWQQRQKNRLKFVEPPGKIRVFCSLTSDARRQPQRSEQSAMRHVINQFLAEMMA